MSLTTFSGPVVSQNGFIDSSFTNAERDAIVDPQPGLLIYNTTDNVYQVCTVGGGTPTWDTAFGPSGPVIVNLTAGVDYNVGATFVGNTPFTYFGVNIAGWTNGAAYTQLLAQPSGTVLTLNVDGTTYECFLGSWMGEQNFASFSPSLASGGNVVSITYTPYVATPPNITSVSPDSGTTSTSVAIAGTGFTGASVTFNGVSASFWTSPSDTFLGVNPPSGLTGTVDVTVTTPLGSSTEVNAFTYVVPSTTYTQGVDYAGGSFTSAGLIYDDFTSPSLILQSNNWLNSNYNNLYPQGPGTVYTLILSDGQTGTFTTTGNWSSSGPTRLVNGTTSLTGTVNVTSISFT